MTPYLGEGVSRDIFSMKLEKTTFNGCIGTKKNDFARKTDKTRLSGRNQERKRPFGLVFCLRERSIASAKGFDKRHRLLVTIDTNGNLTLLNDRSRELHATNRAIWK